MIKFKALLWILAIMPIILFSVSQKEVFSVTKPENDKNSSITEKLIVVFYNFNRKTGTKGKMLGTVILENGKLSHNVSDPNLIKLLKSDIIEKGGDTKEEVMPNGRKVIVGGVKSYKSGSKEQFESIIRNSKSYGYYTEKVK